MRASSSDVIVLAGNRLHEPLDGGRLGGEKEEEEEAEEETRDEGRRRRRQRKRQLGTSLEIELTSRTDSVAGKFSS